MEVVALARRWHVLAWLLAQIVATAVPLVALDPIGDVSMALVYAALLLPFAIAVAYGAWLSSTTPLGLERIPVGWHVPIWLAAAAAALSVAIWATVGGPPAGAGSAIGAWITAVLLPVFGTLVLGAYTCSRLFRGPRAGGGILGALIGAAWVGSLLLLAGIYFVVVIVLAFTSLAAHAS